MILLQSVQKARIFLITCGAVFMTGIDNLIVTIALPMIRKDLATNVNDLTWTVNAYMLTYAVFMLGAAILGDKLGRRRIFQVGLAVFVLGSAMAALPTNVVIFGIARAIQGLGAAILMPLSLTLLIEHVPNKHHKLAIASWSATQGLATAIGPFIGGVIVAYFDWRWIFWINVPIGLLLIPMASLTLKNSRPRKNEQLDIIGQIMLATGLFGLVLGTMRGGNIGWFKLESSGTAFTGTLIMYLFFFHRERRLKVPLIPLHLFRTRGFTMTNLTAFFVCAGMYGIVFLLSQYIQVVLKYSPLATGISILPWTLLPILTALPAAILAHKWGMRPLMITGTTLQCLALIWFALNVNSKIEYIRLLPGMLLAGLGMGLFFALIAAQALSFVESQFDGVASGLNNSVRQIGIMSGIALITSIFTAVGGETTDTGFEVGIHFALWLAVVLLSLSILSSIITPGRKYTIR
ncbi:MFS transporter [Leptospira santarosai]|uniref:MFS transporter n=1 Tax=Leptospira santarosai TaxID=28183 RepID=UPI0024AF7F89|nr:MFS transporter [Leptospira santarosai]MDI7174962.1 MFS transporter [Leptospira santarosai]MDI7194536.1 MFS transporter [Leptospira santarosai]MDO6399013.1 MFS transporter [Leptospira santarosai]MDO6404378.1 MFS transporter [Leptospira santarosai]